MRVVLLYLVAVVGVVSAKRHGDGKGTLQMMEGDYCGAAGGGAKCEGDNTHVVCMRIDQEFWDTTGQSSVTGEGEQHNHCICVGALTYYMSQKGLQSIECGLIDCDGSNFASPSYLSEEGPETDDIWNNGKSPYQATKPARDAVRSCCQQ